MRKLNETLEFWNKEVDEYDDIVSVKELAREDINELISEIKRLKKGIDKATYDLSNEDIADEYVVDQIKMDLVKLIGKDKLSIEETLEAPIEVVAALFHEYVKEQLLLEKLITSSEFDRMIVDTSYWELLKSDPQFVLHYNVEYWVDHILKENDMKVKSTLERLKEHMDENAKEYYESLFKRNDIAVSLNELGIKLQDDKGRVKSVSEIINEITNTWESIDD